MRKIVMFAALLCLALAAPKWQELEGYTFEAYTKDFNKKYTAEELITREAIFNMNIADIKSHNTETAGYRKGVNQFTDMTAQELKSQSLGLSKNMKNNKMFRNLAPKKLTAQEVAALPTEVDWRTKGVVSPVKDQGRCGSCWAFAAIASIESAAAIQSGHLKTLSTQQLVSCTANPYECGGSGGCDGSTGEISLNYAQIFGITSEFKYPYTSYQGETGSCSFNPSAQTVEVTVQGYYRLPTNSYEDLLWTIANIGPVIISVDASYFSHYESGVFSGCTGLPNVDVNHAVTLVGYGTDAHDGDFWLVRNSWGTTYGENGYIRIQREATPICSIDYTPLHGNACAGFGEPIKVCGQCGILSDSSFPVGVNVVG